MAIEKAHEFVYLQPFGYLQQAWNLMEMIEEIFDDTTRDLYGSLTVVR